LVGGVGYRGVVHHSFHAQPKRVVVVGCRDHSLKYDPYEDKNKKRQNDCKYSKHFEFP
jgi:hypothetical protein